METVDQAVKSFIEQIEGIVEKRAREKVMEALGKMNGHSNGTSKAHAAPPRPRAKTSPMQSAARKLQGAYMGNLRSLSKKNKELVKAHRAKTGSVESAIKLAVKLKNGKAR